MMRRRAILALLAALGAIVLVLRACFFAGIFIPVRIAGSSMVEALRGAHDLLVCDDCGFPCRYDADWPPDAARVVCPNCGHVARDLTGATRMPGDRVLLDRWGGRSRAPHRWELLAFRSPQDPTYFEVKRVVGLPGERISIRHGDLYADGRIVRKTLRQLRDMAILVHDSGFEPPADSGLPARWTADQDGGWTVLSSGFRHLPDTRRGGDAKWLVYHHWRCFASPLPRTDESPVLDNYGYNQNESRHLHRVRDLMLVCRLRIRGTGSLRLRLQDAEDTFQVVLDIAARQAIVYRNGRQAYAAALPSTFGAGDTRLDFAVCDRQVLLAIDDGLVVRWAFDCGAADFHGSFMDHGTSRAEVDSAARCPIAIAADGLSLTIRRLQVFRDLHYLDPRGLAAAWTAPDRLDRDEVLVLGDNVPVSRDSRNLPRAGIPRQQWLGRVVRLGGG